MPILAFLLTLTAISACLSPVPVSLLIRAAFHRSIAVAPEGYDDLIPHVEVIKDLTYPSEYQDNVADLYIPRGRQGPFPVVLWIHGGAFVGGDKRDVSIYATALAAEGFAVVCINYRRAPEAGYPAPLLQTGEAYRWLTTIAEQHSLDLTRFALAGDSAGAHIAAQFVAIQSNATYADEMGLAQMVPLHTLRATLLFCGPFDVARISQGDNPITNFLLGQAAWAYFGIKDFPTPLARQVTIANHVTGNFPPTFITDGTRLSFASHGRDLADTLLAQGVLTCSYFPAADMDAGHEYQFIMNTPAGQESFQHVVEFLETYLAAAQ